MSNKSNELNKPAEPTNRAGESQKLDKNKKKLPAGVRNQSGQSSK